MNIMSNIKTTCLSVAFAALVAQPCSAQIAPAATDQTSSPVPGGMKAQGVFIEKQGDRQWRGDKFVGLTIYGKADDKLGEVSDFLVDDSGMITAVVIGVGGFLGIGEKFVAVPFSSIKWNGSQGGMADRSRDSTGSSPTARGNQGDTSRDAFVRSGGIPNRSTLNVSKEDLQKAPSFAYAPAGGGREFDARNRGTK
jgi:sporulation protein YlmC with PRC-barrel domain